MWKRVTLNYEDDSNDDDDIFMIYVSKKIINAI
jgi:hypothetical protein